MRIALLTDGIYPWVMGGMQKHSYNLARQLALQGIQVHLVHGVNDMEIPDNQGADPAYFEEAALKHMQFSCYSFPKLDKWPGHYLRENRAYSRMIYENIKDQLDDYDFMYIKGFAGWELLKRRKADGIRTPVGINFHGYEMYQKPPSAKVWLAHQMLRNPVKWNTRQADYVFSYGGKISNIIAGLGVSRSNILEIPAGIEEEWLIQETALQQTGKEPRKFVFVGRYERRKGIEELMAVLKELLAEAQLDFEFHFIGPIPEPHGLADSRLTFHGSIPSHDRIRELLKRCEVLVCSSHSEGMPNVILEGMACGLAIIATDVGAIEQQVQENGWLLEQPDKHLLKEALIAAIQLPAAKLQAMRERSINMVREHFLWQKVAASTIDAIQRVIVERV